MEDFILTVKNEDLKEMLEAAIQGKGAFRRFKEVLSQDQNERERWFAFKHKMEKQRITDWLEGVGIEPVEK